MLWASWSALRFYCITFYRIRQGLIKIGGVSVYFGFMAVLISLLDRSDPFSYLTEYVGGGGRDAAKVIGADV